MTMQTRDVIVIGAGIMGLSIAYQLVRRSRSSVLVLEKGNGIGEGSTGASSAVCRFRYTFDEVVQLSRDGIEAYRRWAEFVRLPSPRAEFQNVGVLWMPGDDEQWAPREHARLSALAVHTTVLDTAQVRERYPALSVCTLAPDLETGEPHECRGVGRCLLELDGGYMDPVATAADLLDACGRDGVEVRFRTRVMGIERQGDRATGVVTSDGEHIPCAVVVNASGPWCNDVFAAVGLDVPWTLAPTRVQILHIERPDEVVGDLPVCVDFPGGIYFRPQNRGRQIVLGSTREEDELEVLDDPDALDRTADAPFLTAKLHALHHRLPALPYRGPVRGYAGLYTMNREDVHPLIGRTPIDGFVIANGFSGHGFKLAPAVGSLVAQLLTGTRTSFDTTAPIEFFAFDRAPLTLPTKNVLA